MGFLLSLFARWGLPEGVRRAAAWVTLAIAAIALLWAAKLKYDADLIERYEAGVQAGQAEKLRKADAAARVVVDEAKADTEAGNEAARKAAQGSSDPLRDGLNALR